MDDYTTELENIKCAYDSNAALRDNLPLASWKIEERSRFLNEFPEIKNKRLLEIGCGTGKDSIFFKEKGFEVTSIDLSPKNIELCKEKGLNAHVMDFNNLDFSSSSFDCVFAMNSLLHAPKNAVRKIFTDIDRILRPKGLFYLGVYGGIDHEDIYKNDSYEPKRFFSLYKDTQIIQVVSEIFDLLYFHKVDPKTKEGVHFQSLILRKKSNCKLEVRDSGLERNLGNLGRMSTTCPPNLSTEAL